MGVSCLKRFDRAALQNKIQCILNDEQDCPKQVVEKSYEGAEIMPPACKGEVD